MVNHQSTQQSGRKKQNLRFVSKQSVYTDLRYSLTYCTSAGSAVYGVWSITTDTNLNRFYFPLLKKVFYLKLSCNEGPRDPADLSSINITNTLLCNGKLTDLKLYLQTTLTEKIIEEKK